MSLYGMMMKDAEESENATAKNTIKDYIKGYVAPLNQQVLDIDEQVEKLTDLQEVQTYFNDTVIEGIHKLKENNKELAGRLSNATNRLSSAENQIKLLEKENNDRSAEICKLTEMYNEIEKRYNALFTIVDIQMKETFMELLERK